jgi:branched-chain amino acid transport system permease protein
MTVELIDRQTLVYEDWDRKQRARIRDLVTNELVDEHARKPLGQHSDALERVLSYFRRQPNAGKYIIVATEPWREYRIAVLSGERSVLPAIDEGETFATEEAAMHGVFLRRLRDLGAR